MPQIERIRLTNVKYDNGKKEFVNDVFELSGKNCAMILENGGGKSLLVQLLLQVVLPNEKIGVRPASDLVSCSERFTGHILVEWLLDDQKEYLLTGFCFTRGTEDDSKFKYFMYTLQYSQVPNDLDIVKLPLVQDRKVCSFRELMDLLQRLSAGGKHRLDIFRQDRGEKHKYIKHLETFNIYEREWWGIKTTNGDEGGMEGFFEKTKKTEQLMERLIIPHVDQVIFNNETNEKELALAFTRHKDNLLSIPKLEKNVKDFATVREEGTKVLEAVQAYSNCVLERNRQKEKVARLYFSVNSRVEEIKESNKNLQGDLEKQNNWLEELKYKLDSIPYVRVTLELQEMEMQLSSLAELVEQAERQVEKAVYEVNLARGKNLWLKAAEEEVKINTARAAIENLKLSYQELLSGLTLYRHTWKVRLSEKLLQQTQSVEDRRQELTFVIESIAAGDEKAKQLQKENTEKEKALSIVENRLDMYAEKEASLLAEGYEPAWVANPIYGKQAATESCQEIEQAIKALDYRIKQAVEELPQIETKIEALKLEYLSQEKLLDKEKEKQSAFTDRLEGLKENLVCYSLDLGDVFTCRGDISARLAQRIIEGQAALLRAGAKKSNLQEKAELSGQDYYIPNGEILLVRNMMEEWGVFAHTGSQWLDMAGISGKQRENYLKNNPLLPYSLIITAKDLTQLKKVNDKWQKLSLNNPVPLLVRTEATLSGADVQVEGLIPLLEDNIYLPWHDGYRYMLSRQALEELKLTLDEQIEDVNLELNRLQQGIDALVKLEAKVEGFYYNYPVNPVPAMEDRKKEIAGEMQRISVQSVIHENQLAQKLKDKSALEEEKDSKKELLRKSELQLKEITNFCLLFLQRKDYLKQKEELVNVLQLLKSEIIDCLEKLKNHRNKNTELTVLLSEENRVLGEMKIEYDGLEVLESDKETYSIVANQLTASDKNCLSQWQEKAAKQILLSYEEAAATVSELPGTQISVLQLSYEDAKAQATELEKSLQGEVKGLKALEEEIKSCQGHIKNYQEIIEKTYNLPLEAVCTVVSIPEEVIILKENDLEEEKKKHNHLSVQLAKMKELKAAKSSTAENYRETVVKKYGQEPYTLSSPDSDEVVLKRDIKQVQEELKLILDLLQANQEEQSILVQEIIRLDENMQNNSIIGINEGLSQEEWQQAVPNIMQYVSGQTRRLNNLIRDEQSKGQTVEKRFGVFKEILGARNNGILKSFVGSLLEQERNKYDFALIEKVFTDCFDIIRDYEKRYRQKLEEIEEDKKELIDRCIQQATRVSDEINSIKRFSKFTLDGQNRQAIDIKLRAWEQQAAPIIMDNYLKQCIHLLNTMKDDGTEEQKLQEYIEQKMSSKELLNALAPLSEAVVRVLKPEKSSAVAQFERWEGVFKWSGGERYAGFCAMFIALISYQRSRASSLHNPVKVLVADNPFGAASSPHILDMVFKLAAANRVQMICLTALTDQNIFKYFDVVYSLKLRHMGGKQFIMANMMDMGFYRNGDKDDLPIN